MNMPRIQRCTFVIALSLLPVSGAKAFWGIGDVTFDPSTYGELVSIYAQLKEAYDTAVGTMRTVRSMENFMRQAKQEAQGLKNMDLVHGINSMQNLNVEQQIDTYSRQVDKIQNIGGGSNATYSSLQTNNLQDLTRLKMVQQATRANVSTSGNGLTESQAQVVTAQSTATLASLAADASQDRHIRSMSETAAAKTQADTMNSQTQLIRALQ